MTLDMRVRSCRSCGARIIWLMTNNNKRMPVNAETVEFEDEHYEQGRHVSHFTTCRDAAQWRRK